ncbi:hypothetical protein [Gandjariella thermophila]|uniref:Uncharacterized protein n=1 Tax=Gandjariella thermophila TaxID=1931992 RepID=A0A4D4JEW2_9PSEU|nr:hypothetical protein [Gandjariella thermophila]GDY32457.1 hypothetical protein GTS_40900 [Gandjariella thermophila]
MLCLARRVPALMWFAVPLLFVAGVLGLTGLGVLVTGAVREPLQLSGTLCGAAAAVTFATGDAVSWPGGGRPWRWVRRLYPLAVLLGGVAVDGVRLPVVPAVVVGLGALALVGAMVVRYRDRPEPVTDEPPYLAVRR